MEYILNIAYCKNMLLDQYATVYTFEEMKEVKLQPWEDCCRVSFCGGVTFVELADFFNLLDEVKCHDEPVYVLKKVIEAIENGTIGE